jgi:hypothetical protein
MNELLYYNLSDIVLPLGIGHRINTTYAALGAFVVLVMCIILLLITRKKTYKNGGDVLVNRNDPTKDYVTWELMSFPDEWKDGDKLIFTVKEHKLDKEE